MHSHLRRPEWCRSSYHRGESNWVSAGLARRRARRCFWSAHLSWDPERRHRPEAAVSSVQISRDRTLDRCSSPLLLARRTQFCSGDQSSSAKRNGGGIAWRAGRRVSYLRKPRNRREMSFTVGSRTGSEFLEGTNCCCTRTSRG